MEIFKPSIYCPSRQTRRLSHGAHTAVSNHTCFRRRPASSAPLIQQRSHRLPTFPKSSDGRSAYHATILPPQILLRESPEYKFLHSVIKLTQLFLNGPLSSIFATAARASASGNTAPWIEKIDADQGGRSGTSVKEKNRSLGQGGVNDKLSGVWCARCALPTVRQA